MWCNSVNNTQITWQKFTQITVIIIALKEPILGFPSIIYFLPAYDQHSLYYTLHQLIILVSFYHGKHAFKYSELYWLTDGAVLTLNFTP